MLALIDAFGTYHSAGKLLYSHFFTYLATTIGRDGLLTFQHRDYVEDRMQISQTNPRSPIPELTRDGRDIITVYMPKYMRLGGFFSF